MSGQRVLYLSAPTLKELSERMDALIGYPLEEGGTRVVAIEHFAIDKTTPHPDDKSLETRAYRSAIVLVKTELVHEEVQEELDAFHDAIGLR